MLRLHIFSSVSAVIGGNQEVIDLVNVPSCFYLTRSRLYFKVIIVWVWKTYVVVNIRFICEVHFGTDRFIFEWLCNLDANPPSPPPPPRKVFLSFFLEDKTSVPDVFSSCSFIPRAHFETSLVVVKCYGYEIWRHKGQAILGKHTCFFNFFQQ